MEKLNIQKQLDSFTNKRLPYWEDFPDFELYMDAFNDQQLCQKRPHVTSR